MTLKYDKNKPVWSLLPYRQVEHVVEVLTFGMNKYAKDNWKTVSNPMDRYFSACLRHLVEWQKGNTIDKESNKPHLAHAICCLLFLLWFDDNGKGRK